MSTGMSVEVYDEAGNTPATMMYEGVQLSDREVAFILAYTGEAHFNATKAYELAYGGSNRANASRMLRRPHLRAAIDDILNSEALTVNETLQELKDVATSEWSEFLQIRAKNGEILDVRMDLSSKVRALELLLRAHGVLDKGASQQQAVVVNINTPGLREDELA